MHKEGVDRLCGSKQRDPCYGQVNHYSRSAWRCNRRSSNRESLLL